MVNYLRPRRGSYQKAVTTLTGAGCLKSGEVFFEYDDLGSKPGKIKLGDGTRNYTQLAYFVDGTDCKDMICGGWSCTTSTTTAFSTTYANIVSSNPMSTTMSAIKQLLINLSSKVTETVSGLSSLTTTVNNAVSSLTTSVNNKVSKSGDSMTGVLTTKLADFDPVIKPYRPWSGSIGNEDGPYNYVWTRALCLGGYKNNQYINPKYGYISMYTGAGDYNVNLYPTEGSTKSASFIFNEDGGEIVSSPFTWAPQKGVKSIWWEDNRLYIQTLDDQIHAVQ